MISPEQFLNCLLDAGVHFFTGVPDSLLKEFCACVSEQMDATHHKICANEGNAVAMAAGHYLATGNPALVYMQNSGLGNSINPLLSLADKEVYGIPMLLLIGWRGEPGVKDEPQHIKQGRVQNSLLEDMEIPFTILDADTEDVDGLVKRMLSLAMELTQPVALVVRKDTFAKFQAIAWNEIPFFGQNRERALEIILEEITDAIVVSTTGKTSREVYEIRSKTGKAGKDFLCVGSMGHASSLALAIALEKPQTKVLCLDGDGALLMHLGAVAVIGNSQPVNYLHVLLNNHCHESVGEQPTPLQRVDFQKLAEALGYPEYFYCENEHELPGLMQKICRVKGPAFLEINIHPGSRADLGRPKTTARENKEAFMAGLATI
ncbi:phosphonopyruvate decarboxylase [Candidatus Cloacimonadaceae bacterium]